MYRKQQKLGFVFAASLLALAIGMLGATSAGAAGNTTSEDRQISETSRTAGMTLAQMERKKEVAPKAKRKMIVNPNCNAPGKWKEHRRRATKRECPRW